MESHRWVDEFPGAITVCDRQGTVLEMNDQAVKSYQDQGGAALIGTSLLDCHPEPSRTKLQELLRSPRVNVYTVEKNGVRKLICHVPWYADGRCQGLVELSLEVPGRCRTLSGRAEEPPAADNAEGCGRAKRDEDV